MEISKTNYEINEALKRVKKIKDNLGMPVDQNIQVLVAALQVHGLITIGSCGGHLERKTTGPYIDIVSPNEGQLLKMMQDGPHEGPKFRKNRDAVVHVNLLERKELYDLLIDFYNERKPIFSSMLVVQEVGPGRSRLYCQLAEIMVMPEYQGEYADWLKNAQTEMRLFGEFLAKKTIN